MKKDGTLDKFDLVLLQRVQKEGRLFTTSERSHDLENKGFLSSSLQLKSKNSKGALLMSCYRLTTKGRAALRESSS